MAVDANLLRSLSLVWNQVESYVAAHSEGKFSHGFCPECARQSGIIALNEPGKNLVPPATC